MGNKKRVLYAAFDVVPSPKGASTHIVHNIRGLVNSGYYVHLVTPHDGHLPDEECWEGTRKTRVRVPQDANFLKRALVFGDTVLSLITSENRYDVVHYRSIWSGYPLTQALEKWSYKTVYEVNGLPSIEIKYHYPQLRGNPILEKFRQREIETLALSDVVICPSGVTAGFLRTLGVPEERVHVIPNGVDVDLFSPQPLLERVHTPVILYIGTLAEWQGLDTFLQAMSLIVPELPARMRIVGSGRKRQRKWLQKRARKLGLENCVSIEPPVPHTEIPALIAGSDVCVAPLGMNDRNVVQGCCPIKILEYMAVGRPIVASNLPVVRELVRENVDALLFCADDPQDMARQILRLLKDRELAWELSASAQNRVRKIFTWDKARASLAQVYSEMLGA